jgi:hypothetical protein
MLKKRIALLLALAACCPPLIAATPHAPIAIEATEYPVLKFPVEPNTVELPRQWKYLLGDDLAYAQPDFDDSGWKSTTIGQQLPGSGWRWYRLSFELPAALQGKNLLLNLGAISTADQAFVNGAKIGEFGGTPPNLVNSASEVKRKYPVAAQRWKPGRNVIAVRVFAGYKQGMYEGPYSLQPFKGDGVYAQFNLKTRGVDALELLLFPAPRTMRYAPGAPILVEPLLTHFSGGQRQGQVTARIVDGQNREAGRDETLLTLQSEAWNGATFRLNAPSTPGTYQCEVSYTENGKQVWQEKIPFVVAPPSPLRFDFTVDASLNRAANAPLPVEIGKFAMGHFGPREVAADGKLTDDVAQVDSRSGVAYSAQFDPKVGAPRLFLANTRRVPEKPNVLGRYHRAAGSQYDGVQSAWSYGTVRPNRAGALKNVAVTHTSWAKRSYRYEYQDNVTMDFSISAISPAWIVRCNAQKVRVFEDIESFGVGLPSHLAFESNGKVKIVNAKNGIKPGEMSANWVLAWFCNSKGWEEFDTPYLFVLEKKPQSVQCYANTALFFNYPDSAGTIQGMPLYGVTLQRPNTTQSWVRQLPAEVVDRCRYWSRVLVNAPDEVQRTASVDYRADRLMVRDQFTHLDIKDAWDTRGLKIAPLSPTLALSAKAGNIDIAVNRNTRDLQMATLQGPLTALENTDTAVFAVNGQLKRINEVRQVKISDKAMKSPARAELNRIVAKGLESELKNHPWVNAVSRQQAYLPGHLRAQYSNLLLTLPYLDAPLRAAVEKEIRTETERYFLFEDLPTPEMAGVLAPELKEHPMVARVTNPVNNLTIAINPEGKSRFGIDQVYFDAMNIYLAWDYARTFDRYDWLKGKYELLKQYANATRNSHDWGTSVSWDSFSGLRVGNGHQEASGIFAGMLAMSRIANHLGDKPTADTAAYYAMMQIVGMQAQLAASDYLREYRPWLAANAKHDQIEYTQRLRTMSYAEFNEFVGLSQAIISAGNVASRPDSMSAGSAGSLVESPLPEIMRLYQELWPVFINDFYDPKYDAINGTDRRMDNRVSVDNFVYQIESYPQSPEEVFQARQKREFDWWSQIADYRGYLDWLGERGITKMQ